MADPGVGVDPAGFNQLHHPAEGRGRGVAAGQQSEFPAVKIGVVKCNLALAESDKDDPAALCRQAKCPGHRFGIAGGIEDHGGKVASDGAKTIGKIRPGNEEVGDAETPAELEPARIDIRHRKDCAGEKDELDHAQADRPGAEDQDEVAAARLGPLHRMGADAQHFDQGKLIAG